MSKATRKPAESAASDNKTAALEAEVKSLTSDLSALLKKVALLEKKCEECCAVTSKPQSGDFVTKHEWKRINEQIVRKVKLRLKY